MQTTKMIAVDGSTRLRVNVDTGANASEVSILAMIDQCRPGRSTGRVGLQCLVAEIVAGDQRARSRRAERSLRGVRGDRLHQHGAALPDRLVDHVGWGARLDGVAPVLLRVLQEQPRIRTHQSSGPASTFRRSCPCRTSATACRRSSAG